MRLALAFLLALAAGPAAAVPLETGEHGAFTRLAFVAPRPLGWTVEREDRTLRVVFEGRVPALEVEGAFRRIGRDRIAAIGWDDATLTLRLGCLCPVEALHEPSGAFILDVFDEPEGPPPPPPEAALPAPRPAPAPRTSPAAATGELAAIPLVLEPIRVPLGRRVLRAAEEAAVAAPAGLAPRDPDAAAPAAAGPPQLRILDARAPARPVPSSLDPVRPAPPADVCDGADALATLLRREPAASRAALPDLVAAYEPGALATARPLVDALLGAGLGAEAAALARAEGLLDPWRALLAGLVDADPRVAVPPAAWTCGPAPLLAALAAAAPPRPLTAEETAAATDFAASLPPERRGALLAAAAGRLRDAGAASAAAEIAALPGPAAPPDASSRAAADARALARALGAGAPDRTADEALALLPTLPDGAERTALVVALAAALGEAGRIDAMSPLLDDAPATTRADAIDALTRGWGAVPVERRAVLAAALLRWRGDARPVARARLAEALERAGMEIVAARWRGTTGGDTRPRITAAGGEGLTPSEAAWLSRDLATAAALGTGTDDPRGRLAGLLQEPAAPAEDGTIEGARARLARAREARVLIGAVLDAGTAGGTLR